MPGKLKTSYRKLDATISFYIFATDSSIFDGIGNFNFYTLNGNSVPPDTLDCGKGRKRI